MISDFTVPFFVFPWETLVVFLETAESFGSSFDMNNLDA